MKRPKRRRRAPEEAREEILNAAEAIILNEGPADLKFQSLADHADLAVSNVYHHFGGVLEIKRALAERVLADLARDLAEALDKLNSDDPISYAENTLMEMYDILKSRRHAKLISWIILSTEVEAIKDFAAPLPALKMLIATKIAQHLPYEMANELAEKILYNVAITSIGEGLLGETIKSSLGMSADSAQGSDWLRDYWKQLLETRLQSIE